MNIPKEFYIGGQKITIEVDNNISYDNELAVAIDSKNLIKICDTFKGDKLPANVVFQSLWHETVHQILDKMNEHELSENEKFVQTFSLLLHQVIKTLK
jgi:hypothetical protein